MNSKKQSHPNNKPSPKSKTILKRKKTRKTKQKFEIIEQIRKRKRKTNKSKKRENGKSEQKRKNNLKTKKSNDPYQSQTISLPESIIISVKDKK